MKTVNITLYLGVPLSMSCKYKWTRNVENIVA